MFCTRSSCLPARYSRDRRGAAAAKAAVLDLTWNGARVALNETPLELIFSRLLPACPMRRHCLSLQPGAPVFPMLLSLQTPKAKLTRLCGLPSYQHQHVPPPRPLRRSTCTPSQTRWPCYNSCYATALSLRRRICALIWPTLEHSTICTTRATITLLCISFVGRSGSRIELIYW